MAKSEKGRAHLNEEMVKIDLNKCDDSSTGLIIPFVGCGEIANHLQAIQYIRVTINM